METQTLSLKGEGEAPAMTRASQGLTAQPGRKVGAPDPPINQTVRALPPNALKTDAGEGRCGLPLSPPEARRKGVRQAQPRGHRGAGTSLGEATCTEEGPEAPERPPGGPCGSGRLAEPCSGPGRQVGRPPPPRRATVAQGGGGSRGALQSTVSGEGL